MTLRGRRRRLRVCRLRRALSRELLAQRHVLIDHLCVLERLLALHDQTETPTRRYAWVLERMGCTLVELEETRSGMAYLLRALKIYRTLDVNAKANPRIQWENLQSGSISDDW